MPTRFVSFIETKNTHQGSALQFRAQRNEEIKKLKINLHKNNIVKKEK
jgi:hypothetical protein